MQKKRWPTAFRDFSMRKFALTELQHTREGWQEQSRAKSFAYHFRLCRIEHEGCFARR